MPGSARVASGMERRRAIGLAAGSLWVGTVGAGSAIWALSAIGTPETMWPMAALVATSMGLAVLGFGAIRGAIRLAKPEQEDKSEVKRNIRGFLLITALEIVGFVVANTVLVETKHFRMLPAINLIIIGLHFFPVARLFRVPRYHAMGTLFCAISLLTLLLMPRGTHMGHAWGWYVAPPLGCGAVAVVIAALGFHEVRGLPCAARQA